MLEYLLIGFVIIYIIIGIWCFIELQRVPFERVILMEDDDMTIIDE